MTEENYDNNLHNECSGSTMTFDYRKMYEITVVFTFPWGFDMSKDYGRREGDWKEANIKFTPSPVRGIDIDI